MGRKTIAGSSLFTLVKNHNQFGYQEMAKSLNLLPDNAEYREASRQMKSAWQTRQHRKKTWQSSIPTDAKRVFEEA